MGGPLNSKEMALNMLKKARLGLYQKPRHNAFTANILIWEDTGFTCVPFSTVKSLTAKKI